MADIAVLGPVSASVPSLTLEDGEGMPTGSELYLVGYPAEPDEFPEPTITIGVLSRVREWDRLGMTYFQTDAAAADGQSGGPLVDARGDVVGISTYSFSEAGFGIALSGADVAPIVRRLIEGRGNAAPDARRVPAGNGSFEFTIELANLWDARAFVLDGIAGTPLHVTLDGAGDGRFLVGGPAGVLLSVDRTLSGVEQGSAEVPVDGTHFLQVEIASGTPSPLQLTSTSRLRPFHDPDDGATLAVGETVAGRVDFPSDWDWYSIRLAEGETVRISADSITVDTFVVVDFPRRRLTSGSLMTTAAEDCSAPAPNSSIAPPEPGSTSSPSPTQSATAPAATTSPWKRPLPVRRRCACPRRPPANRAPDGRSWTAPSRR